MSLYNIVTGALRNMDIYLADQVMKGNIKPGMCLLDAGCGEGRNLDFFLQDGSFEIYGCDSNAAMIGYLQKRAQEIRPETSPENFRVEAVEAMSFPDGEFDLVICNAVLHFAKDEAHFAAMLKELWRVLKPGGILFIRLATSIGIEKRITQLEGRHYLLPDGTRRFLADETWLLQWTHKLGARFQEPLKTVNVQNSRCMTTWVLRKES